MTFAGTQKQMELLAFITARIDGGGVAPSMNEMCAHMGLASKSGIVRMLRGLEDRGFILRMFGKARAIELSRREIIVCAHCGAIAGSRECIEAARSGLLSNSASDQRPLTVTDTASADGGVA